MARKKTVDPDAAILRGAPGDGTNDEPNDQPNDPPPPGPKMVKVKVGNLEVEVSEEVAAQMNAERDELNRQLREKDAIVQTLSRKPEPTQQKPPAQQETIDDLIYTDPKRYRELLAEQVKQDMRQEYQRDQYQRQFWETFWNLHPRLKRMEHDVIAESLLSRHLSELSPLPMREAAAALGRKVEDYVRQLTGPARPEPTAHRKPNRTATLEGGPGRSGPVEDSGNRDEEEPSLGDIIKARQNKIRSGASRTTAS